MIKRINIGLITEYLLYVFVFLLPWQTRYIFYYLKLGGEYYEYGKLSIYLSEIFLLVFFIMFIIGWIFWGISKNSIKKSFLFSFLFLMICSFAYFYAKDEQMFSYSILRLSEAVFLMFVLSKIKFSTIKIAIAIVFSILIHAILGIYQFFIQYVEPNKYLGISEQVSNYYGPSVLKDVSGRFLRAYGGMTHPNVLGGFIVIAILLLLMIFIKKYLTMKTILKILLWTALFILGLALVLTFSRSAYIAMFVSIVVLTIYFLYKKQFNLIRPFLLILAISFVLNFLIFNNLVMARIFSPDIARESAGIERIELSKQALVVIKNNVLLGVGLGNYIPYVFSNVNSNLETWQYQPVHNIFLLIFGETGLSGVIVFALIFIFYIIERIESKNNESIILLVTMLSILLISLLDHYFITSFSGLMTLFLVLGIRDEKSLKNIL